MYPFLIRLWIKNRKRTASERLCKLCRLNVIENENHFLCVCPVYNSRRKILFEEVELKHVHIHTLPLSDKFIFVMKHCQIEVSKFMNEARSIRQTKLQPALIDTNIFHIILDFSTHTWLYNSILLLYSIMVVSL